MIQHQALLRISWASQSWSSEARSSISHLRLIIFKLCSCRDWLGFTQIKCKPEPVGDNELMQSCVSPDQWGGRMVRVVTNQSSLISLPECTAIGQTTPLSIIRDCSQWAGAQCRFTRGSWDQIWVDWIKCEKDAAFSLRLYNNQKQVNHWELNFSDQTSETNLISDM